MTALKPLLSTTLALTYAIFLFAHPPHHRKTAFVFLLPPITYAFLHHLHLTPWFSINDTFGRFLYIWLANTSHLFLIIKLTPPNNIVSGPWKQRLRYGMRAISDRRKRERAVHELDRWRFCVYHGVQALLYASIRYAWDTCIAPPVPSFLSSVSFHSLNRNGLWIRAGMARDVCVADMLYFETLHSFSAIFCVGILRLDTPRSWALCLFGRPCEAYTVRRYWGVYWHDYIALAFSAHVKLVTRELFGLRRGAGRRVLENFMVFGVSGVLHGVVRCVQTDGRGDVWTVALWYSAQIIPIVLEGVVRHCWVLSEAREKLERSLGAEVLRRFEKAVGYVWVFCWMVWSVGMWMTTRQRWEMDAFRRRYPEVFAARDARLNAGTMR